MRYGDFTTTNPKSTGGEYLLTRDHLAIRPLYAAYAKIPKTSAIEIAKYRSMSLAGIFHGNRAPPATPRVTRLIGMPTKRNVTIPKCQDTTSTPILAIVSAVLRIAVLPSLSM